jgi:hypothetical protein
LCLVHTGASTEGSGVKLITFVGLHTRALAAFLNAPMPARLIDKDSDRRRWALLFGLSLTFFHAAR